MNNRFFRKRNLGLFIKVLIALLAFWFVYREIELKNENTDLSTGIELLLSAPHLCELMFLFVLMLMNWLLEALKWQLLMEQIEKITLWRSMKAIFSGVTVAVFTPNRIGEYGGRVFHLKKADRIDATLLTIVGSYAQLTVTIVSGLIAGIFYLPRFVGTGPLTLWQYELIGILVFGFCVFLVILFMNTRLLSNLLSRIPFLRKYRHYTEVFRHHRPQKLWRILIASAARYGIFTFQFYLLLHIFDVEIAYSESMMMIAMTYFVMTAIPTFAITELGVRGSVAVYFIEMVSGNTSGIFLASSMLWLLNLAIPALIGVIFIFDLRFFRNNQ